MPTGRFDLRSVATKLTPRHFWFFLEFTENPADVYDRYQAEVAVFRLNTTASDLDVNRGIALAPLVLRTWHSEERKAFRMVRPSAGGGTRRLPRFDTTGVEGFPALGAKPTDLPALVLVCERLEPDCEYAAFARVHDSYQWGPWARIAQMRLDFIGADDVLDGHAVLDLPKWSRAADTFRQAVRLRFVGIPARLPLDNSTTGGPSITATLAVGAGDSRQIALRPQARSVPSVGAAPDCWPKDLGFRTHASPQGRVIVSVDWGLSSDTPIPRPVRMPLKHAAQPAVWVSDPLVLAAPDEADMPDEGGVIVLAACLGDRVRALIGDDRHQIPGPPAELSDVAWRYRRRFGTLSAIVPSPLVLAADFATVVTPSAIIAGVRPVTVDTGASVDHVTNGDIERVAV